MPANGSHREFAPPPALRGWVEAFWSHSPEPGALAGAPRRIAPDNSLDLVVALGERGPALMVVGAMTRALVLEESRDVALCGVRFRPGCAFGLLVLPAAELNDQRSAASAAILEHAPLGRTLERAANIDECLQGLTQLLLARAAPQAPCREVEEAMRLLGRGARVDRVAEQLGVTRQHLARRFAEEVGVSPKIFARVSRLQRLLARLGEIDEPDWSALALDAGYCDQPHLIGEFDALLGISPTRWWRERRGSISPIQTTAAGGMLRSPARRSPR